MKMLHSTCVAALALCVGAAGVGCRGWETDKPPVHLNPNMDTQEKGKAYRKADLFADGRAMRTPPAGTVAQGFLHDDDLRSYGLVPAAEPGKMKVGNAFPEGLTVDVARGRERYGIYCSPCHGLAGDGDGIVNGYLGVKAPSMHDQRLKEMPAGQIYQAMLLGVNGGNMGSYAGQIVEQDRWNVIAYVRAMQQQRDPSVTLGGKELVEAKPRDKAEADWGKELYVSKNCSACHSIDGSRLVGPSWLALYGRVEKASGAEIKADEAYLTESIRQPMAKIVEGYPPAMPPYDTSLLSDLELESLILYIKTLK